jgi:hypothetical protein
MDEKLFHSVAWVVLSSGFKRIKTERLNMEQDVHEFSPGCFLTVL